jgi:TrwC relaxase
VLSIGEFSDNGGAYYLRAVAQGVEDYYVGHGEAPGRWLGTHAGELGLSGGIESDDLAQVLDGQDPVSP